MMLMSRLSVLAIVTAAALPLSAWAQQPAAAPKAPKPTVAAAQKVVQIIGADKAKAKSYCDIAALGEQLDAAAQKKDEKKMDELSQKVDDLAQKVGPEYVALMNGLDDVDPDSKEGKEIGAVLEGLDKLCDAK
ncbi:MAG: hypothetical protein PSV22_17690 [Pseudolabrys sp.]|jgi:hypothetical protein|nr:hypothetical protein [Pseudolabrys sp.]